MSPVALQLVGKISTLTFKIIVWSVATCTLLIASTITPQSSVSPSGTIAKPSKDTKPFAGGVLNSTAVLGPVDTDTRDIETKLTIILNILLAFIIFSNLIVIIAYFRYKRLRTITNRFVLSLAFADLFVGISRAMQEILFYMYPLTEHRANSYDCLFFQIIPSTMNLASLLNLLGVTIDRYISVMNPLRYNAIMTEKLANTIILIAWGIAFFVMSIVPHFVYIKPGSPGFCSYYHNKYTLPLYFALFTSILLTISLVYGKIFYECHRLLILNIFTKDFHPQKRFSSVAATTNNFIGFPPFKDTRKKSKYSLASTISDGRANENFDNESYHVGKVGAADHEPESEISNLLGGTHSHQHHLLEPSPTQSNLSMVLEESPSRLDLDQVAKQPLTTHGTTQTIVPMGEPLFGPQELLPLLSSVDTFEHKQTPINSPKLLRHPRDDISTISNNKQQDVMPIIGNSNNSLHHSPTTALHSIMKKTSKSYEHNHNDLPQRDGDHVGDQEERRAHYKQQRTVSISEPPHIPDFSIPEDENLKIAAKAKISDPGTYCLPNHTGELDGETALDTDRDKHRTKSITNSNIFGRACSFDKSALNHLGIGGGNNGNHKKMVNNIGSSTHPLNRRESAGVIFASKTTIMIAMIVGTFALLGLPIQIMEYVLVFHRESIEKHRLFSIIHGVCLVLYYSSSTVNPYIYAWKNKDFRESFKQILTCRHRRNSYWDLPAQESPRNSAHSTFSRISRIFSRVNT